MSPGSSAVSSLVCISLNYPLHLDGHQDIDTLVGPVYFQVVVGEPGVSDDDGLACIQGWCNNWAPRAWKEVLSHPDLGSAYVLAPQSPVHGFIRSPLGS